MPKPPTYGPYDSERQTHDSPLLRDIGDVTPARNVHTSINRMHLTKALRKADVNLGTHDRRIVDWLAGWEPSTVQVVIGLISRAYAAGLARGGEQS